MPNSPIAASIPSWKQPQDRSASNSPLASSTTLSQHGDSHDQRGFESPGLPPRDPSMLIDPKPSSSRETSSSPKRIKINDQISRHISPDEREAPYRVARNNDRGRPRHPVKDGHLKGKKLACPYLKRDPRREGRPVACIHPGFSNVARLKEHLYRIHKLPAICPRCQQQFNADEEVTDHLNATERCEQQQQMPTVEGFNRQQELRLRTKKRSKGEDSEEEKWKGVFLILFPGTPQSEIPPAYVEPDTGLDFPNSPNQTARILRGFEDFSHHEMRNVLAGVGQKFSEIQIQQDRLLEVVQWCQAELIQSYCRPEEHKNAIHHELASGERSQHCSRSESMSSQISNNQRSVYAKSRRALDE